MSGTARRVAALCALAGGLLLATSAPALAANERGHVFGFSFGEQGSGSGKFEEPVGVAVDEATGEVYVVDRAGKKIERFKCPITEQEQREHEEAHTPPCSYLSQFEVPGAESIAVDNSTTDKSVDPSAGDVYVASAMRVVKFTAEGTKISVAAFKFEAKVFGVAVDAKGTLWVSYGEGEIESFSDAQPNALTSSFGSGLVPLRRGLAVDSKDHLYVDYELEEQEGKPCRKSPCLAGKIASTQSFELEPTGPEPGGSLVTALDHQNTTGVAVDLEDDGVYLDNATSVAAFSSAGAPLQRFGSEQLKGGAGLAVDSKSAAVYVTDSMQADVDVFLSTPPHEPVILGEGVSHLESGSATLEARVNPFGADTKYHFEYGTSTAYGQRAPIPPGDLGSSFKAQSASAQVSGLAAGTVYHYRVVAENGLGKGTVLGPDQTFKLFVGSAQAGLLDGRMWEMVSPANKEGASILPIGAETTSVGIMQASEDGSSISYTADAPIERHPEGSRGPERTQVLSTRGAQGWSSQDITTADHVKGSFNASGEPPEYKLFSGDLSLSLVVPFRLATSERLAEPPLSPAVLEGEAQEKTIYLRADAPVLPSEPESAEATVYKEAKRNGEIEAAMHGEAEADAKGGYLALLTAANVPGNTEFGGLNLQSAPSVQFLSATPDLTHVVLESAVALTAVALPPGGHGLYEWTAGKPPKEQLQLASILEGTTPAPGTPRLGTASDVRHAISNDGSRVFWEAGGHLYVRDMRRGETVQLDLEIGEHREAFSGPIFQTASADGSKVFFTDEQKLVSGSGAGLRKSDLYECELVEQAGKLACHLTDLTETKGTESAGVQGAVLGTSEKGCEAGSEEGCNVYFVANGALAPDATPGGCESQVRPGETCNLYMRRYNGSQWEPATFIAALANEDIPDWESPQGGVLQDNLARITSRVSPNGRYLAFMSEEPLTGYDNLDVNSGAPDEEVYLYDASTHHLICASCNPDGSRSAGVLDAAEAAEAAGEGALPLVDRAGIWREGLTPQPKYLAGNIPGWTPVETKHALYQSRYLTDSGRLFFNAADGLVGQDKNGKEDVYEYEPEGVGTCTNSSETFGERAGGCVALISSGTSHKESAFLEASESGGDVYFLTAEQLAATDQDTNYDLYDAHECTKASPCPPPPTESAPPCHDEEKCRVPFSPQSGFAAPGSATFSGSGNVAQTGVLPVKEAAKPKPKPLTRAQKLAKALKACRKTKNKHKRVACEKQARKKYGPKKSKAKTKSSSHRTGR
jgi:DNA-binding beta-propeller fold protein YncE